MQYFDVKRNSGNIFSHGPMISILTDWTLILAKCCRGNESWERILFLLRLKKKWRRKKKNDHRPCPRKERADGRNWLDVNPVDRSCSSSSVSEGNTFSSNYWFLCSSPSTCTDPCGHLCVAAAQKKNFTWNKSIRPLPVTCYRTKRGGRDVQMRGLHSAENPREIGHAGNPSPQILIKC